MEGQIAGMLGNEYEFEVLCGYQRPAHNLRVAIY